MPRYTKRKKKEEFKPLKNVHQHAHFLGGLRQSDWKLFQKVAQDKTHHHRHVHAAAYADLSGGRLGIIHALTEEHKARKRGEYVGGGLGDALNSIGSSIWSAVKDPLRPIKAAWHGAQNLTYPMFHDNSVSEHTHLVASALSQSYVLDESIRADYVDDMIRDQDLSTNFMDVWVDDSRHPPYALISVRGSKKAEDFVLDDVAILGTGRSRNLIEQDLRRAVDKYANDYTVEVAGHSLGTTLIAQSLQADSTLVSKIDRIDMFNPATSPIFDSIVSDFTDDSKFYFYENQADLVGLGQMLYSSPPKNLTMRPIQSLNPMTNHGIDQWMPETELETGQLDESQQANLKDPSAGLATDPESFKREV